MFRNRMAQQVRQQMWQGVLEGWRAQHSAAPADPAFGIGASPPSVMYLQQTYSIPAGANDPAWAAQKDRGGGPRSVGGHTYSKQDAYAKAKTGQTAGFGFANIADLFGEFHVALTADGTGESVHYVGNAKHTDTKIPGGVGGGGTIADYLFNNDFGIVTADGVARVEKYLYQQQTAGGYEGIGPTDNTATVAKAIATLGAKSLAERSAGTHAVCDPFGDITRTQAQILYDAGKGRYSGCIDDIRKMAVGSGAGGACPTGYSTSTVCDPAHPAESAPGRPECKRCRGAGGAGAACSSGYSKKLFVGGAGCGGGQKWEVDPANSTCGRCAAGACPDDYSSTQPSCGPGYRVEPHPTSPNCWACRAACPGGYVPPDQATCPAAQQQADSYYNTGCVKCGPACPQGASPTQPTCPPGQKSTQDAASGCWSPCVSACPPGYYVLDPGAPFTCPPYQQRKVDQASGCVACETSPNCFQSSTGLSCGPGQTAQAYGDWTCCAAAPSAPPPSAAAPSTAPPVVATDRPPGTKTPEEAAGVTKAGLGWGGGLALAAVAAIAAFVFAKGGGAKAAASAAGSAPSGVDRPRGMAGLRGRIPR